MILDELEPGEKLPAEGKLAERLGVSRLTIREAIKVLAGQDLLELRAGARATVTAPTSVALSRLLYVFMRRDPRAILELTELRHALEERAAGLAAERATTEATEVLDRAVLEMRRAAIAYGAGTGTENDYHEADLHFHEAIAEASGNRMLSVLLTSLEDSMRASFVHSFRGHFANGSTLADRLALHEHVAELIAAGDSPGAVAAMSTLLAVSERDIRASLDAHEAVDNGAYDAKET